MSNLSPRALTLYQAHGPGPVDWERMVRVVDRAVEMSQPAWQPIETAPKDTDLLLAWWRDWPSKRWHYEATWASASNTCSGGYSNGWSHGEATHWIPLPAPPAEGEAGV